MLSIIEWGNKKYRFNFRKPVDISIPLRSGTNNPNAFGIPAPLFTPLQEGSFIGSVDRGGSVNCENILLNAHGNGTHTECTGHIASGRITINQCLKQFVFMARLISVSPRQNLIGLDSLGTLSEPLPEALIFRTLPNDRHKMQMQYSGTNPAAFDPELLALLARQGVKHLLTDLPSVDPEHDEGKLLAHHAFWQYPFNTRMDATITEMIYVPDEIEDGLYLLHIQIASIESDASPSKPVIYFLQHVE